MPKIASAAPVYGATKVAVTLNGREYFVTCDAGEEHRLQEIVKLVDSKLGTVADRGGNMTESRFFMLTCLMLADELIESRRKMARSARTEEDLMVAAVEHLRQRVATIAQQIGRA